MSASRLEDALAAAPLVVRAREATADLEAPVWIVGGAVRDALLGRPLTDMDLATPGPASTVAHHLSKALGGKLFELSDEFDTWRVVGVEREDGDAFSIDVAALRADSIEADLALRDFTVNAIAVPLSGAASVEAVDPTGGIADLEARRLRVVSARSFDDDPLRLMRLARLGAEFGLEPEPDTLELARGLAQRAAEPAGERRWAELRGMLSGSDPLRALELLDEAGVTAVVLPPLAALRGVGQSANHHLDVYDHTIEVLRRWLEIERDLPRFAGDVAGEVAAALAEPLADDLSRRDGIRFAAILHDIGKPATRTEQDGFVGFRGHDAVGAEMIRELCAELRTSRRFAEFEAAIARDHLILGFMTHERPLSRRRIWDYLSRTGREALDTTLLTVADRLSAQGSGVPAAAIEAHLELAREMLAEIVVIEREGPPAPLLNGTEIVALLGVEGEDVGKAVRELQAAQFAGEVADRDAAESHLRAWHERARQQGSVE